MAKKWIFLILIFALILSSFELVYAQSDKVEINFFYSSTCPHCKKEKEFLGELRDKYPQLEIKEYEVIGSRENQQLLGQFYERYNVPRAEWGQVPVTFTENKYFLGFSDQIGSEIEGCVRECIGIGGEITQKINIPLIGEIDISKMSLPVLAVTLGALDGFNPCAMWVLLFLITLLVNARSKKRMYLIGGTFVLASGIIYFLILAAWLNLFLVISYVNLTRILIGALAIFLGLWQIKNFTQYQPGTCQVVDGKAGFHERIKNGLKSRAEKLVLSPLNLGIMGGIIVLALGVNMVEFFCSAGLPAIFTRVLTLNNVSTLNYYLYLLLYTFVFMLDDLIIFSLAIFALSKIGFTEKYNYWATLIGGIIILALGILLIFKPEFLMFT